MTAGFQVFHGDNVEVLASLPDNSVDSVVTDPPYGLGKVPPIADVCSAWLAGDEYVPSGGGFMGKEWDAFVPGPEVWRECLRVLKPGGHLLAFFGTRTVDVGGLAIRFAGFEVRDTVAWMYGSGFPKSLDVSKAIDKRPGVTKHPEFAKHLASQREKKGLSRTDVSERVVGSRSGACWNWEHHQFPESKWWPALRSLLDLDASWGDVIADAEREITGTNTKARAVGSGSALPTLGARTEYKTWDITTAATDDAKRWEGWGTALKPAFEPVIVARKPLVGTVAQNVLEYGTGGLNVDGCRVGDRESRQLNRSASIGYGGSEPQGVIMDGGQGRWPANVIMDAAAGAMLDNQAGGNPSRFFYCPKAGKKERNGSKHPTVKPLALMRWLVRLVTPPGGVVLDPFAGTGTTGQAALLEGMRAVLIEADDAYQDDIRARLRDTQLEATA